jgi:hypothetical protein
MTADAGPLKVSLSSSKSGMHSARQGWTQRRTSPRRCLFSEYHKYRIQKLTYILHQTEVWSQTYRKGIDSKFGMGMGSLTLDSRRELQLCSLNNNRLRSEERVNSVMIAVAA